MASHKRYPVRPALHAVRQMGLCIPSVFKRAQLSESLIEDKHFTLDAKGLLRIFTAAAEEDAGPDFGFRFALQYARIPYGPAYFAFACSPNIGAGIKMVSKYKPVASPIGFRVEDDAGDLRINIFQTTSDFPTGSSVAIMEFAYILELQRNFCDGITNAKKITLCSPKPEYKNYEEFFGCSIVVGSQDLMWIGSEDLSIPLHAANLEIGALIKGKLDSEHFPSFEDEDIYKLTSQSVKENLYSGQVGVQAAAHRIGISTRTLHRKLRQAELTFTSIQSEARREIALELLADRSVSISELSFRLGFKETASFYRAFKTWHGVTPAQMRKDWSISERTCSELYKD